MDQHAHHEPRLDLAQFIRDALAELDELQDSDICRLVELAILGRANNSDKIIELIRELHSE